MSQSWDTVANINVLGVWHVLTIKTYFWFKYWYFSDIHAGQKKWLRTEHTKNLLQNNRQ